MRITAFYVAFLMAAPLCPAQEIALRDAKKEITAAMEEVKKVASFCRQCKATGAVEGKTCPRCQGRRAMLKSEERLLTHRAQLELKAEKAGLPKDKYADFDMADRLTKYDQKIEPEALELFTAYVGFVKACDKHKDLVSQDERFARLIKQTTERLDRLIDRHGPRLVIRSMTMLYEDDPVGKVGAFRLYGKKGKVRIGGKDVEWLQMRTFKQHSILLIRSGAKQRSGFVLAEIIAKGTHQTDDGKEIQGILMQAY